MTGDDFRAIREELALYQAELGSVLGRTSGTIANWEKGRVAVPQWAVFQIRQMLRDFRSKKVLQSI